MNDEMIANRVANEFSQAGMHASYAAQSATEYWESMRRPSMMLRPTLRKIDQVWNAIYGDPDARSRVIGIGNTPEEAYLDFDRVWVGKPDPDPQ